MSNCDHSGIFLGAGLFAHDCTLDLTENGVKIGEVHRYVCQGCGESRYEKVIYKKRDPEGDKQ